MEASIFYECGHAMEPGAPIKAYCPACREYCVECTIELRAEELDPTGRCYHCLREAEQFALYGAAAEICFCGMRHDK
jgi:hypothetical protein